MPSKTRRKRKTRHKATPKPIWFEGYEHRFDLLKKKLFRIAKNKNGNKGWTTALLAEWTGVSTQTINNLVTGRVQQPRISTVDRLCEGLDHRLDIVSK